MERETTDHKKVGIDLCRYESVNDTSLYSIVEREQTVATIEEWSLTRVSYVLDDPIQKLVWTLENRLEPIRLLIDRDTCTFAGVIIVLIKERIDLMKRVHILTPEENKLSSKQLEEYMEFAAKK